MHQDVAYQAWPSPHSPAWGGMNPFPAAAGEAAAGGGHIISLHTTMAGVMPSRGLAPASRDSRPSRHLHPAGAPDHAAAACLPFAAHDEPSMEWVPEAGADYAWDG